MLKDFILPDIGEGIVECQIVEWLVREGDAIEEDQIVVEVSTDKSVVEIPSIHSGTVVALHYKQGDTARVHEPLFSLEVDGIPEEASPPAERKVTDAAPEAGKKNTCKVLATPAVRRIARENNLNLAEVTGSGEEGRILREDVLNFLQKSAVAPPSAPRKEAEMEGESGRGPGYRVEPITGVRAVMASKMTESVSRIPHFTYMDEMDLTELVVFRKKLKELYAAEGLRITIMPLFMKALSLALKEYPILNSRVNDEVSEIQYIENHNIGMAVDTRIGLLVPNVKNVETLSILEVTREVNRITLAAREGKVAPDDLSGGTITLSNMGAIGGTAATPIIYSPEVAIVGLGRIQRLPRFDEQGNVAARDIMTVSWSGDHRIIDGGTMARFCGLWMRYLQKPNLMLAAMR